MLPTRFERPVNWRLARIGFRAPATHIAFDHSADIVPLSDIILFLPQDRNLDVIVLRDWLHNSDNNGGGYQMTGCYEADSNIITFTGLKFSFARIIDAIIFRLFWCTAICIKELK